MKKQIEELKNCLSELSQADRIALKNRIALLVQTSNEIKSQFNASQQARIVSAVKGIAMAIGSSAMFGGTAKLQAQINDLIRELLAAL